jgi:peroxiredoxin Q/BCP
MDIGERLPQLTLEDQAGEQVALTATGTGPLVVYFYPKDDTPGCTTEAKDFTALAGAFAAAGASVVGISRDSVAKHAKFVAKHELGVRLLSDEEGTACEAFGTWVEKSLYGRRYMGIERATFVFDRNGMLIRVWRKARVKGHATDVLTVVESL